ADNNESLGQFRDIGERRRIARSLIRVLGKPPVCEPRSVGGEEMIEVGLGRVGAERMKAREMRERQEVEEAKRCRQEPARGRPGVEGGRIQRHHCTDQRSPRFIAESMYSDARQLRAMIVSVGFLCVAEAKAAASSTKRFFTSQA